MKKLIALYKAFRGGEWFEASLRSIEAHVDGIVVVLSSEPWTKSDLQNNCSGIATIWRDEKPAGFVELCWVESRRQEEQYAEGLRVIREKYGEDSAVLVVDTDEVWTDESLAAVKRAIETQPSHFYFRCRLHTYLRSPEYQVWPQETATPVVALQNAKPQDIIGRFRNRDGGSDYYINGAFFHHLSYVRAYHNDIEAKFAATSSQEDTPSSDSWLASVWPNLPRGKNLHMTTGSENCWGEIKILPRSAIPVPEFCQSIGPREEMRWQKMLESDPVDDTLIPTPNQHDEAMYPEFDRLAPDVTLLRKRLKVTYLESLILHDLASHVPDGGNILEIGSGSGGSLAVMALASKARMWAVDPFAPYDETTHAGTVRGVREGNEKEFWETARHYGYVNRVRHIKLNSDEAAEQCPDGAFDIVFVDGNHSYDIVKSDRTLYWAKVKPGGILLAHDYTTRFCGVVQAMKEWGVDYSVFVGTSLAYARKQL